MNAKTHIKSGIADLDGRNQGVQRNAIHTLIGASKTGKSSAGIAFLQAGLEAGECGCVIGHNPPPNVMAQATALGWNWQSALNSGNIRVIQYRHGLDRFLPEYAMAEFGETLVKQGIKRLALDPVTPWLIHPDPSKIVDHVRHLARILGGLGLTTLCLSREPNSPHAERMMECLCGLSASVSHINQESQRLTVLKNEQNNYNKTLESGRPRFLGDRNIKNDKSILRIWK